MSADDARVSDVDLLHGWKAGDQAAGNALFRRHVRMLFRFFRTKVDGPVDDLVQDTLLGCLKGSFRGETDFQTYLLCIARNRLYSYYKRRQRGFDPLTSSVALSGLSPSAAVAANEDRARLLAALRRIPLEAQTLLELYYWNGLKGPALAQILDISPHTVRSRMSRARSKLRDELAALQGTPVTDLATLEREADFDAWARGLAPTQTQ
ncbi:MAG: RNA polymerase sigma factor [Nannocystaceae bacterium]|nr:sigma-70 family RNA polymerase sigma factor [bacterium]